MNIYLFLNSNKQEDEKPPAPNKWDYFDNGFKSRNVFKGKDYAYQLEKSYSLCSQKKIVLLFFFQPSLRQKKTFKKIISVIKK